MSKDRRFAIVVLGAALHLVLVLLGAVHLRLRFGPGNGAIPRWYATMTASQANFAFYAPAVPAFPQVTFVMTDASGEEWTDVLERGHNEESDLRLSASAFRFEESGNDLVAAWANALFRRHPRAVRLVVHADRFDPPTMDRWRAGDRGHTERILDMTFDRPADL